jgi:hypothetical protein
MENLAAGKSKAEASVQTIQVGVSRPELPLSDLPTPEEVFDKPKIGFKEMIMCVLGPSMIALGAALGSGEWLLGPLAFGRFGFMGLGWLIALSAVLQTFYNVENARYTLATGEVPIVGFTRTPPGFKFWVSATLIVIYLGWIWGGWASSAGQGLFTLFTGRQLNAKIPMELETVRLIAIGLMILSFGVYLLGKKISRTLEIIDTFLVFFILGSVAILAAIFAPASLWGTMLASIVTPGAPPKGIDATTLGSIIGYTGFGTGMNFMLINYYRDHGYGMGSKVGFFSGVIGGQKQDVLPSGVTFPESERNTRLWKRWFRYLMIDQWAVFFIGAMIGMFIPSTLCVALTQMPGAGVPSAANMPVYVAIEMSKISRFFFPFMLLLGTLILFKTQTTVLEMLIRNTVDAANAVSPRLRAWIAGDARKAYYTLAIVFIIAIGIIIHLALPTELLQISANMANLACLIYPFVLIYLNAKLPKPARARWWSNIALLANVLFFGFFFFNFLSLKMTGHPLVKF